MNLRFDVSVTTVPVLGPSQPDFFYCKKVFYVWMSVGLSVCLAQSQAERENQVNDVLVEEVEVEVVTSDWLAPTTTDRQTDRRTNDNNGEKKISLSDSSCLVCSMMMATKVIPVDSNAAADWFFVDVIHSKLNPRSSFEMGAKESKTFPITSEEAAKRGN